MIRNYNKKIDRNVSQPDNRLALFDLERRKTNNRRYDVTPDTRAVMITSALNVSK